MANFFEEIFNFFEDLSTQPDVGGLQITNSSVQYVSFKTGENNPIHYSFKLPPGVIERGRIQDKQKLVEVLRQLHLKVTSNQPRERAKVVVCLPSDIAFTQNFNIPNVGKKRLEESAELNLQMVSPIQSADAYMSWQLVSETRDQYGVLGAFSNKDVIDDFKSVLLASNFHPVAIEFPSLSLSWTVNRVVGSRDESILILNVSSDGIDIFLLRNGYIYFDYFKSWKAIQGNSDQISQKAFNNAIVKEVKRVINFTTSHFNESLRYTFLIAPGLEEKIKEIVENNFDMQVSPLQATFGDLGPAWYASIGSAIRAGWRRDKDRFISLGTGRVEDMFYKEQTLDFIKRWRNIFSGAMLIFLILFIGAGVLLRIQPQVIQTRLGDFDVEGQREELQELEEQAEKFNNLVGSIDSLRSVNISVVDVLNDLQTIARDYSISLNDVGVPSLDETIQVSARAPDSNTVIRFKNELERNSKFTSVSLPFSEIVSVEGNFVRFNIGFQYTVPDDEESEE